MTQFIEVTPQSGNSKIVINSATIQSVVTDLHGKTCIYFLNTVVSSSAYLTVRESYEDIKNKLIQ